MSSSIIFIGTPEKTSKNVSQSLRKLFFVQPLDLTFRIFTAFVPPVSKRFQKVYVDFLGPILALLLLVALVNYGYSMKQSKMVQSPTEVILTFFIMMPILCLMLCKIGRSNISVSEIWALIGYSLFGHIATLFLSFLCFDESSNFFFFVCLIFFGGLSTLRITLVILATLNLPAVRLLVCSIVSIINILFTIFLHLAYMHKTFIHQTYSAG